jgi:glutathione S-transferase
MELYFSPMACSLASRISLYEAGAEDVQFVEVDPKTKRTTTERAIATSIRSASCPICGSKTARR